MNKQTQQNILNAVANDLSLLPKTKKRYAEFSKENKAVLDGFEKLKQMKMRNANTETLKLIDIEFMVIPTTVQEANTQFKNIELAENKAKALASVEQTKNKIEAKTKELLETKDLFKKEAIIKEIGKLSQEHRTLINKDNAKTPTEILRTFKYDPNRKTIPTYIREVDELINGGFERSTTNVISATPHNGKTTMGIEAAASQAMNDYRVLYLSLEQTEDFITQNIIAYVAEEIEYDKPFWDQSQFKDWKDAQEKIELGTKILDETTMDFLKVEDTEFNDVNEILDRINLASEQGYDIVYIDNFQNLKYSGERTQAFEKFAEGLLEIAKKTGIAIVSLSQLTVDNKGNVKTKFASKLNDDASNHLKITRVKKEEEDDSSLPDMIDIYVEKTRRGRGFDATVTLPFIGSKGIIGKSYRPIRTKEQHIQRKQEYAERKLVGGFFNQEGLL